MSFLETNVSLEGTVFTGTDLQLARDYLEGLIASEDPAWLFRPAGYLSRYWLSDDLLSTCFLIDLALNLNRLELSGLDTASKNVFFKKVQNLLRKTGKRAAFEEAVCELEVAALLSEKAGPLLLEPRILELKEGSRPRLLPLSSTKLVDMALSVSGEILFAEVTVLRVAAAQEWQKNAAKLRNLIMKALWLERTNRNIGLTLPFPFSFPGGSEALNRVANHILDTVAGGEEGNSTVSLEDGVQKVEVGWSEENAPGEMTFDLLPEYQPLFIQTVFKSLRNSLQIKREQFHLNAPLLLVMQRGDSLLSPETLAGLIRTRLFANPRFKWLSAIALYLPRSGYSPADTEPTLRLIPNRVATYPLNTEIKKVLE